MTLTRLRIPLAAAALLGAGMVHAETFDAAIGEDSFRLGVNGPLSRLFNVEKGEYDVGAVYGKVDDDHDAHFFSSHAGVMLTGDAGAPEANLKAGIGARLQYVHARHDDGGAVALGGQARLSIPGFDRVGLTGYGWFAPDVSSFGDIDKFDEFGLDLGYEILRDAEVYVGYRWIGVSGDPGGHVDLEKGAHIGIRMRF